MLRFFRIQNKGCTKFLFIDLVDTRIPMESFKAGLILLAASKAWIVRLTFCWDLWESIKDIGAGALWYDITHKPPGTIIKIVTSNNNVFKKIIYTN